MTTATRYAIPVLEPEATISTTPQWTVDLATRLGQLIDGSDSTPHWETGWSDYGDPFHSRIHAAAAARRVYCSGLAWSRSHHVIGATMTQILSLPGAELNPVSHALGVAATSGGLVRWDVQAGPAGPTLSIMRLAADVTLPVDGFVYLSGIEWDY